MKLAQTDLDSGMAVEGQAMSGLPSRLETVTKKQFITIPQAVAALANMEHELDSGESYAQFRKLGDAAEALKILFRHVAEVKKKAELVVLAANARIGDEIKLVPKATPKAGPKKQFTAPGKLVAGRAATGVPGTSRSRLQKSAAIPKPELKAIATKIQGSGGDAPVTAVLRELKETEIKDKRADFEARADKGAKCVYDARAGFTKVYSDPANRELVRNERNASHALIGM